MGNYITKLEQLQLQQQQQQQQAISLNTSAPVNPLDLGSRTSSGPNPLSSTSSLANSLLNNPSLSNLSSSLTVPHSTSDPSFYSVSYIPTIREINTYAGLDIHGLESLEWDSNKERHFDSLVQSNAGNVDDDWVKSVEPNVWGHDQKTGLINHEGKAGRLGAIIQGRGKVPRGINELGERFKCLSECECVCSFGD